MSGELGDTRGLTCLGPDRVSILVFEVYGRGDD